MRHLAGTEEARSGFEQNRQDSTSSSSSKNDSSSGGSNISEDSIAESRARLNERLLPIHRILEDSRTRVSEESLCSQLALERTQYVIPNRLHAGKSDLSQEQEARTSSRRSSLVNINEGVATKSEDKLEKSKQQSTKGHLEDTDNRASRSNVNQKTKDASQEDKKHYLKDENTSKFPGKPTSSKSQGCPDSNATERSLHTTRDDPQDVLLTNLSVTANKYRDFTQFTQPRESKQLSDCNIPMIEFSGPRLSSPVATQKLTTDNLNLNISLSNKELQSPDYGLESDMKTESRETFYDLIGENEDGIKFADDDDEYIDNRANL